MVWFLAPKQEGEARALGYLLPPPPSGGNAEKKQPSVVTAVHCQEPYIALIPLQLAQGLAHSSDQ